VWEDRGHTGADVVALDQRVVADQYAVDIGDRVERTRLQNSDRDSQITEPWTLRRLASSRGNG
jgi:hypothetical protein